MWELKITFATGRIKFNVNFLKISIIEESWTCDSSLFHSIIAEGKIIYENIFLNALKHFIKFMFNWKMLNVNWLKYLITDVIGVCDNVAWQQYLKLAAEKPNW